jgi:hypothetical protein
MVLFMALAKGDLIIAFLFRFKLLVTFFSIGADESNRIEALVYALRIDLLLDWADLAPGGIAFEWA